MAIEYMVQRRKKIRAEFEAEVSLVRQKEGKERRYSAQSENLGIGGMCVRTPEPFEKGDAVKTHFIFDVDGQSREVIEASGVVAWKRKVVEQGNIVGYRLGVSFTGLRADVKENIMKNVRQKGYSPSQIKDYEALRQEIIHFSTNAFNICWGSVAITLAFLPASFGVDLALASLFPLIVLYIGSVLFFRQITRIRRAAAYIRVFYPSRFNEALWENNLFGFRNLWHSGKNFFSREYIRIMQVVGGACVLITACRYAAKIIYHNKVLSNTLVKLLYEGVSTFQIGMIVSFLEEKQIVAKVFYNIDTIVVLIGLLMGGLLWFGYCVPHSGKRMTKLKGAGEYENEQYFYFSQLKRFVEIDCEDLPHVRNILEFFFGRNSWYELDEKRYQQLNKKSTSQCRHNTHCSLNAIVRDVDERIRNRPWLFQPAELKNVDQLIRYLCGEGRHVQESFDEKTKRIVTSYNRIVQRRKRGMWRGGVTVFLNLWRNMRAFSRTVWADKPRPRNVARLLDILRHVNGYIDRSGKTVHEKISTKNTIVSRARGVFIARESVCAKGKRKRTLMCVLSASLLFSLGYTYWIGAENLTVALRYFCFVVVGASIGARILSHRYIEKLKRVYAPSENQNLLLLLALFYTGMTFGSLANVHMLLVFLIVAAPLSLICVSVQRSFLPVVRQTRKGALIDFVECSYLIKMHPIDFGGEIQLFPPKTYTNTKKVSLISWLCYYFWSREWIATRQLNAMEEYGQWTMPHPVAKKDVVRDYPESSDQGPL